MFDQLFKRPYYVNRHIHAPFLEERVAYLQRCKERGRATQTLRDIAQYLLRIIEFLKLEAHDKVSLEEIELAADKWARYQYNHPQKRRAFSTSAKAAFIWHAIGWLKMIDRLATLEEETEPLITKIFERGGILKRHATAPLLKERLLYLQFWHENGAPIGTLRHIAQYLLRVIEYLNLENKKTITIDEIRKAAHAWSRDQANHPKRKDTSSDFAQMRFLRHATSWLNMLGYLQQPTENPPPFSNKLTSYIEYMRQEQGLSEETINGRHYTVKNFLTLVFSKTRFLEELTIIMIDEIISIKRSLNKYSRRSIQNYVSVIRSFLRYAEQNKWCANGIADSLKLARVYKHESLPYGPSWDEVTRIIATTDGDHPTNVRDRAVLLLLSVYGLRRIEVANITLDDIDWKNNLIYLSRAKNGRSQTFPLSETVGTAILRYITEVRQNNTRFRNVFICRRAPFRPLNAMAITAIVNRRWQPLNVKIKHHGAHSLRHACATHLINSGISLKEISNHLGHTDIEATRIYAKVDLVNLRKIADFDLEDLL